MALTLCLFLLVGLLAGALAGGLVAWRCLRHRPTLSLPVGADPWTAAAIDQAATAWAMQHGRPEAAPLMADKLHLLHRLGSEREAP